MIKTLNRTLKQDRERFTLPKNVQDIIPVQSVYPDGIFQTGKNKFSKTFRFEDINYYVASSEDKKAMFLGYSEILNALDSTAVTKLTINNRRLNRADFKRKVLIGMKGDSLDVYRKEYDDMLSGKAADANSIVQEKYITITVSRKNIEEARTYFRPCRRRAHGTFFPDRDQTARNSTQRSGFVSYMIFTGRVKRRRFISISKTG